MRLHRVARRRIVRLALTAMVVGPGLLIGSEAIATPAAVHSASTAESAAPLLVAVRAGRHTGYDRVVFEFSGGGPSSTSVQYVDRLIADGSGLPVPVSARAILQVVLHGVDAHTTAGKPTVPMRVAYDLPNVITTVQSGDFEGVVSYGIGVAAKSAVHTQWLTSPRRLVIDVDTTFRTVDRVLYFADSRKIAANVDPPVTAVRRSVVATAPATGLMDRLYAGPTPAEQARGLTLVASGSTGYTALSISAARVARVQLTGQCSSGGSAVVTVASEIMPTLKQFPTVDWVKIYDPQGSTEHPTGQSDSIPECLEP